MTYQSRTVKLSNPGKLLRALMRSTGQTDTKSLSEMLDMPMRTIQRLKLEIAVHEEAGRPEIDGANSAISGASESANDAISGVSGGANSAISGAQQKEIPPKPPKEKYIPTVENPTHVEFEAAREVCLGDGVFADERTIRHRDFTISLPGLLMGVQASGASSDEVRAFAVAQALQWAAELAAGGDRRTILPARMANALAASFMHAHNRAQIHGTRVEAAKTVVPFPARQPEPQRRGLMDEIRARRAAREQAEAAALATGGAA